MPDENPFDRLPRALVDLRLGQGLKQAAAARLAGLAKQTLSEYEAGKTTPSLVTLGRLLLAYGTDVEGLGRELKRAIPEEKAPSGEERRPVPSADEIERTVVRALKHYGLLPEDEAGADENAATGKPKR